MTSKMKKLEFITVWVIVITVLCGLSVHGVQGDRVRRTSINCPQSCNCGLFNNDKKLVNCSNTEKTNVPQDIPRDSTLVDLSNNVITGIGRRDFNQMVQLRTVDLSRNAITAIDGFAFDAAHLEFLDLSFNPLRNLTITDLGQAARSLRVLNISDTNIRRFPVLKDPQGRYMTQLKRLVASNNHFAEIPYGRLPIGLEYIDVSCLEMRMLRARTFRGLLHLKEIRITGCDAQQRKLTAIERGTFQSMPSLQLLDLKDNALTRIPRGLPTNILVLDLSHNSISRVKSGQCSTAESVDTVTSEAYFSVEEQTTAQSNIGSELSSLTVLRRLDLSGNLILHLCIDDFMFMRELKDLNLSSNTLKLFHPQTFVYPSNLESLDLSYNNLVTFNTYNLVALKEIYLQGNRIGTVQNEMQLMLPSLRKADFSNNPYRCDCHITGFVDYVQTTSVLLLNNNLNLYSCFMPVGLRGQPLINVIPSQLICEEVTSTKETVPPWAIAAPVSLVGLIGIVIVTVIVVIVRRKKKGEKWCCKKNEDSKRKVVSKFTKYEEGSDIVIKNDSWNDAAILCHQTNQTWILNAMIPKLHRHTQSSNSADSEMPLEKSEMKKSLNLDVFTVGKTIRIDRLNSCIDSNRKIVLIITFEFLGEESCVFILKTIHERMQKDPKESVIIVLLDATPWKDMPVALQRLMVEKSFVQFPQSGRHRQEFYFWDTLCALVCRTTESGPRRNWLGTEVPDDGDLMPTARHVEKLDDYGIKNRDVSTIRSIRRARDDETPEIGISAARAARLRRLGIDRNGEVVCEVRRPMKEPEVNTVSNQVKDDPLITLPSSFDPPIGTSPNSTMKRLDDVRVDDVIHEDPDDEMFSSRNAHASHRRHRGKLSHTLLPPNCGDAESIYSAEEEEADVRPRDRDVSPNGRRRRRRRHREHTTSSRRHHHEHRSKKSRRSPVSDEFERPKNSRRSPVSDEFERPEKSRGSPVPDEFENLHGTVEPPPIPDKEYPRVPEPVSNNCPPKMEKKKRWQQLGTSLSRLKSFF
ncbi:uncharacterized protein LOC100179803 [Ciona intestinalis]